MRRPKLEKGNKATPWVPAESEGYTFTDPGFLENGNRMKIYDMYVETHDFIEW